MANRYDRVLALDIAPNVTGWAFGDLVGKFPLFGFWRMPDAGGEGALYAAFANCLWKAVDRLKPSALVYETPLPPYGQSDTSTAYKIYTMRGYCYEAGHRGWEDEAGVRHSFPLHGVGISDWRMALHGRCRWPGGTKEAKDASVQYVRKLGLDVTNHDAAEAVMVWLYFQQEMRRGPDPLLRDAAD